MRLLRHLDYPDRCAVDDLGPAGLEDLLDRGDLGDWGPLVAQIKADPYGALTGTVLRLCAAHAMYGTSAIWTTWIERLRRTVPRPERTLRRIRRDVGPSQAEVARRMGSTQSERVQARVP